MPPPVSWSLLALATLCCLVPRALAKGSLQQDSAESDADHQAHLTCHNLANIITDLAFAMYTEPSYWSNTSNILFSPLSITAALAMLSLGAWGDTRSLIQETLKFNPKEAPEALIHGCFQQMIHRILQTGHKTQLLTGSSLFMDKGLRPVATFLEGIKHWYHSKVTTVHFQDTKAARKHINGYVEKETKRKIRDVVQGLDSATRLVLVNYIFFHGKWIDEVQAMHPVQESFHVQEKRAMRVPMVNHLGTFYLHRDESLSSWVLVLHGVGGDTAFFLLPDPKKMGELERRLTRQHFEEILRHTGTRSASVFLPRFSISGTHDLRPILGKLGITNVFSDKADFSRITRAPVKLSKALHKAVLIMNEGFTKVRKANAGNNKANNLTVKFNRPFLFILKDNNMHFPLFVGKVVDPTAH
ncbi:alpha-1-antitrypsin-related protein [Oryctolagus cuniculus]|uniref:alpha-1-antitrypsin-related protein n=1 Tax=Oryctolagus cuniculus TaxID=9986 RepID=UPI000390512D|nr:alpha-1-antitrypsin-related protein [Oryctolagus cuniculus]